MNDVWYQLIHDWQEYVWVWIFAILVSSLIFLIFLWYPVNRKQKKAKKLSEQELERLFDDLKDSRENAEKLFDNYNLQIKEKEAEIDVLNNKILERENHILILNDLPEEIELQIKKKNRTHNITMFVIGLVLGVVISISSVWIVFS